MADTPASGNELGCGGKDVKKLIVKTNTLCLCKNPRAFNAWYSLSQPQQVNSAAPRSNMENPTTLQNSSMPSTVSAGQHKEDIVSLTLTVVKLNANSGRSNQQKDEVFQ